MKVIHLFFSFLHHLLFSIGLSELAKLHNLRNLNIGDNTHITSEGVTAVINGCPALEYLDFSDCARVDKSTAIAIANNLPNLEILNAEFCEKFCTDETLEVLSHGHNSKLQKLLLMGGLISDKGISALASAPFKDTLRILDFRRNASIEKAGYNLLFSQFQLDSLDGVPTTHLQGKDVGDFFVQLRMTQMYG